MGLAARLREVRQESRHVEPGGMPTVNDHGVAAPRPGGGHGAETGLDRVTDDVAHRDPELWVGGDAGRAEAGSEDVARLRVAPVEGQAIRPVEALHPAAEV